MKRQNNLFILAECSIMVSLATVLSVFKLFEMPYGGSITFASMLPIAIVAYRYGIKMGVASAFCSSVIQMLLGLKHFSFFTTPESFIALALFDYLLAFGVFGIAGIFRKTVKNQSASLTIGVFLSCLLRYICHVISGATVWAGLSIPTEAALIYSFSYNATYMIPETIIMTVTAIYLGAAINFSSKIPTRIRSEKANTTALYFYMGAGLAALIGLIIDTVIVFSRLQNPETGDFDITAISTVDPIALISVTAVSTVCALTLFFIGKKKAEKS